MGFLVTVGVCGVGAESRGRCASRRCVVSAVEGGDGEVGRGRRVRSPVLFVDVMDTLVVDPFTLSMHAHFGFPSKEEFLRAKTPGTWIDFEKGVLEEEAFLGDFFTDGREVDGEKFKEYLRGTYTWIEGMETLVRWRAREF